MKKVTNPQTGNEELHFDCKIVSIGDTILENSNGKEYVVGTIEFENKDGSQVKRSCLMYSKPLTTSGKKVGDTSNCRAIPGTEGNEPLVILDPIEGSVRATAEDFQFEEVTA